MGSDPILDLLPEFDCPFEDRLEECDVRPGTVEIIAERGLPDLIHVPPLPSPGPLFMAAWSAIANGSLRSVLNLARHSQSDCASLSTASCWSHGSLAFCITH